MTRKAFLIGGVYSREESLPGVHNDIKAWKTFLMSSIGGSWLNDEISDLTGVPGALIRDAIKSGESCDYALVCFSGHGGLGDLDIFGMRPTMACINDFESLSEYELNPRAPRSLTILDCCRTLMNEPESGVAMDSLDEQVDQDLPDTREIFDREILKCEKGWSRVYATGENSEAEDKLSFTRCLIKGVQAFMAQDVSREVLRINEAVELANELLPIQQVPEYEGGRRLRHFPFAINQDCGLLLG